MKQEWKKIDTEGLTLKGYYKVSNKGGVIRGYKDDSEIRINPKLVNGYECISLRKKEKDDKGRNRSKLVYVHRAVAELFIDNPNDKPYVIHKDFDVLNNEMDNLAWATNEERAANNSKNPRIQASIKNARKHIKYKLDEAKVKVIKKKILDPKRRTRMRIIAKQHGISMSQLYRIKNGQNWAHVKIDDED
ncbi:MAG: HNH endonuclease [Psychroflexus sp.]